MSNNDSADLSVRLSALVRENQEWKQQLLQCMKDQFAMLKGQSAPTHRDSDEFPDQIEEVVIDHVREQDLQPTVISYDHVDPRYDEEETGPDEEECLIVRRALSGAIQEESLQHEIGFGTLFGSELHGSKAAQELFPLGLNGMQEIAPANPHEIIDCGGEGVFTSLNYEGKDVLNLSQQEKTSLDPYDQLIKLVTRQQSCTSNITLCLGLMGGSIHNRSLSTSVKWDPGRLTLPYAFKPLCIIRHPPEIPPEPPPEDSVLSLRTNFFKDGEDDRLTLTYNPRPTTNSHWARAQLRSGSA